MKTTVQFNYGELSTMNMLIAQAYNQRKAAYIIRPEVDTFWINLMEKLSKALVESKTGPAHAPEEIHPSPAIGYFGGTEPTWNARNSQQVDADVPMSNPDE